MLEVEETGFFFEIIPLLCNDILIIRLETVIPPVGIHQINTHATINI